ncbi:hypothetical protein AWB80_04402 [Caballeronia pedi]|uniref:Type VI secretion system-associated protein TagO n=1 Tax=Caballeronia pedi TaxID=1777141 RepID=A0A158C233_9BURK|nr:type VI secretion system-associated protein VasI [Caballeronia pedi]SAK75946.1 hypothetical protein AWB80_04402 [Caballeronia pedi]
MRLFVTLLSLSLLTTTLGLAGCGPHDKSTAAAPWHDCTSIASPVRRLACFDAAAGTPPEHADPKADSTVAPSAPAAVSDADLQARSAPAGRSAIAALVQRNEAERRGASTQFLLSRVATDDSDGAQMIISAPALGSAAPRPYLVVSCISGITRLQLLTSELVSSNRMRMRLFLDGKPLSDATTWQVLDTGDVVDAGRGLVAIDLVRRLSDGARLRIESDYPQADGLMFDATGLKALIAQEREACHW